VDVVKDVSPLMTGGFIYPFSEFATPTDQLVKRLGYQADPGAAIKEAKSLLAAAGQSNMRPLDFMVRDLNHHKLFAQAIEAMLKEMGIQSNLRTVVESVWFGDAAAGNYDLAVGAIVSTLLDPSDYFNAWYRTGGPQNYSFWNNAEFDKLVDQIDVVLRPAAVSESLTVVASAPVLDTTSSSVGTNLDTAAIETLPTGRNYASIVQVAPGVSSDANPHNATQSTITVYGSSGALDLPAPRLSRVTTRKCLASSGMRRRQTVTSALSPQMRTSGSPEPASS